MAALKNAPDLGQDDLDESVPGTESTHGHGFYAYSGEESWQYAGVMPVEAASVSGGAGPVIGCRWIRGSASCC
jgi:hypothetical protein